jgi:hypothetical protein
LLVDGKISEGLEVTMSIDTGIENEDIEAMVFVYYHIDELSMMEGELLAGLLLGEVAVVEGDCGGVVGVAEGFGLLEALFMAACED